MNKKFLPNAVLFTIGFMLSNLASLAHLEAQNTFYGEGAGNGNSGASNSGFGYYALPVSSGSWNTAIGDSALLFNSTGNSNTACGAFALYGAITGGSGSNNTATGYEALLSNTTGSTNTASGSFALHDNTTGNSNTASGYTALQNNTTGDYNTATGRGALQSNDSGDSNTATGTNALFTNTTGAYNTATGDSALALTTTGRSNTAAGVGALFHNTTASYNTASGYQALLSNTIGGFNTANGAFVLYSNSTGNFNTATGPGALFSNTTGSNNVAVGTTAGFALTTGSGNVCIGAGVNGVAGESNTTRIRNVYTTVANGRAVYVNSDNKIGTLSSSRRFKQDIQPMDKSSETLFALKPVTFRYNKDADSSQALSFGLIAEDVAQVSPDLITRDEEGKPQTVRYEAVNAMLLNEFLKEHKKNEAQGKTIAELKSIIAQQQRAIDQLATQMQKVSAQVQLDGAPAIAVNP